jgi:hypothetical protein
LSDEIVQGEQTTVEPLFAYREKKNRGDDVPEIKEEPQEVLENSQETSEPSKTVDLDQVLKELDELKKEKEKLDKQVHETRKWGNEQRMKLTSLLKAGDDYEELAAKMSAEEVSVQEHPFEAVYERWKDDLQRLKPIMEARGENVEEYYEAFNEWLKTLPADKADEIADEILSLPSNKWTPFMLSKGQEFHSSFYSEIKKSGSYVDAYKSVKQEREKLASDYEKLKAKYDALKSELNENLDSGYGKHSLGKGGSTSGSNDEPASPVSITESFLKRRNLKTAR